jgi:multidrug efflux system outer membrane protein
MHRVPIALLVLPLAGCLVGPDYNRPSVEMPQSFRFEVADAAETANTAWWLQFQDPVLDDLIAEALASNKGVQIAAANVEQAAAVLTQTRAPLYPQVGAQATGAQQRATESGATPVPASVPNPQTSYQVLAGASWEIDLWGRIRRLSEAARAQVFATEEAHRGVILSLVASVANSYVQLRSLDEQLVIARRTLGTYDDSVKLFELQFEYGQISEMTVQQARTQYETVAATIPQIEFQIAQTENAISILLGRNPGPIPRGKSIDELTLPAVPAGIPSQVLEQRPDIQQAEQNLIAANALIGAARALYFPTISLTGVFGQASAELGNLFKGPARTWSYSGSITGPIFTGGAISGQVRQAEAGQKAALLAYEAAIQSAFADAETALVAREKLIQQLEAQGRLVTASREYARLAQLQFDGGVTPYFTVLQAEQQLFPAELNHVLYRGSLFASVVNIYKAMGGGWVVAAEKLAEPAMEQETAPPPAVKP